MMPADPLSAGSFRSMDEVRAKLIEMGPKPETYDRLLDLIEDKDKDSAKDALSNFFQGASTALCFIYQLLIRSGKANAVDEGLVAEIAQMHPEVNEKVAGLWIPDPSSGLGTKMASGGVGGVNAGCSYMMHGPDDKRMCPKLQNAVSTFICRYHCLDGLMIDDNQVLCGEAIWRQSIMDKFSRDFKDADGKWKGGYLRNRLVIEQNTEGNEYQLKPGERTRPIKESAWSTEKRLQEMRKELGDERGYEGVYEPEKAYNFDPHEMVKGPENVQLDAKERDKIAKNASNDKTVKFADSMTEGWVGSPGSQADPQIQGLAKQDPRELMPEPAPDMGQPAAMDPAMLREKAMTSGVSEQEKIAIIESGLAEGASFVPQGGLFKLTGAPQAFAKSKAFNLKKKANLTRSPFNLSKTAKDMTPSVSKCMNPQCKSGGAHMAYAASGICPFCKQKTLKHMSDSELTGLSGAIEKPRSPRQEFASVRFANGAYEASVGDTRAFGGSKEEALKKLADLLPGSPGVKPMEDPLSALKNIDPGDAVKQSEDIKEILDVNAINPEVEPVATPVAPLEQVPAQPEPLPEVPPVVTDDDVNKDIAKTWGTLSPEELQELEQIEQAAGAGPDPKSDLQ